MDSLRAGRRKQPNRERHQPETEITFPDGGRHNIGTATQMPIPTIHLFAIIVRFQARAFGEPIAIRWRRPAAVESPFVKIRTDTHQDQPMSRFAPRRLSPGLEVIPTTLEHIAVSCNRKCFDEACHPHPPGYRRRDNGCRGRLQQPRNMPRAILVNVVSMMLSHESCFGVKTNSNRFG